MEKVVIALDVAQLQQIERIVLDDDLGLALEFVKKVVKPAMDAILNRGHCKPTFEWRRDQPMKIGPPPIPGH